ncbi:uncharacterized protein LOC124917579 [Impatiens glandulifera]|uniref:uncharacterized protein LOC124917579 n=1 Tax=Impatiens glandulifera TaxID=253017 RepID=UPI001FB081BF|nr:uncharacterized protein LOC124917579 [Impatiens glandulifera]
MARRRVKQISDLKRQVDDVEARISSSETVEILRIDAKERLRLNESLMSLLLKLDSVHGTVPGVRDCRKAVIKKAIALQEKIDAIVTATDDETIERKHSIEKETVRDDSIGGNCNRDYDCRKSSESTVPFVEHERLSKGGEEEGDCNKEEEEEEAEMKKWGRKMVMEKLLESNEIQMRMIRSLTERIEQLEKALVWEKLKKKQMMKKKKKMRHFIVGEGDRWELRNY